MLINECLLAGLVLVVGLIYVLVLVAVFAGLLRLRRRAAPLSRLPMVSVVIAARNERERILPCLASLEKLDYPPDAYEIILVDDASTDNTVGIMQEFCGKNGNWRFFRIEKKSAELKGKKNALSLGIAASSGEIIFTTDADCVVPPAWLRVMASYFSEKVAMVLGYSSLVEGKGFVHRFLEFDNVFSAISIAVPAKLGYPYASVGRNLAYRREAYERVGGFASLTKYRSGDDTHLTERFRILKAGIIRFCAEPETFVRAQLPLSAAELFNQQVRKNSRHLRKSPSSVALSLVLFISYLLPVFMLCMVPSFRWWCVLLLGVRFAGEFVCLAQGARIFGQCQVIKFIPLMQILYPIYLVFFSILGYLRLYKWKK